MINANGTVAHKMGDKKSGNFAVKYRPGGNPTAAQVTRHFSGIVLNVPVTEEALAAAYSKYSFTVGGVKLTGVLAAAAAKFLHAAETIRGDVRKGLESGLAMTDTEVQKMFREYTGPSGERGGFKPVVADEAKVRAFMAAGDTAGMLAYLAEIGTKMTAVEETADDDAQDDEDDTTTA